MQAEPEQEQGGTQQPNGGKIGSVEFGGFSITHVEKGCYAVTSGNQELAGPPSLADSEDTDPGRLHEVEEEDEEDEDEDPDSMESIARRYAAFQ